MSDWYGKSKSSVTDLKVILCVIIAFGVLTWLEHVTPAAAITSAGRIIFIMKARLVGVVIRRPNP